MKVFKNLFIATLLLPGLVFASINVGDKIITSDFKVATVLVIYGSATQPLVIVRDDNLNNLTYSIDELASTSGCLSYICTGDKVITSSRNEGVVKGFFSNGKIIVKSNFKMKIEYIEDLAFTRGCAYNFCIGDKIVTSDDFTEIKKFTIAGFFGNGTVAVKDAIGLMLLKSDEITLAQGVCK